MINHFLRKLYNRLRVIVKPVKSYPVIYNANGSNEAIYNKRALLVYIVEPFLLKDDDPKFFKHQNLKRCRHITSILGEFGYVVDVVDIRDRKFRPSKDYDLIISNRVNLRGMENYFRKGAVKIFFASVISHKTHIRNLRRRHELLSKRRGCRLEVRRLYSEVMPYVTSSDAITGFGNEFIMNTWREVFNGPVYPFDNCGFKGTEFILDSKDFSSARNHFLFFASGGQVQKGLDLLLEVFPKHPNLHLYVCSGFENEPDFCACYYKELYRTPNIHPIGWVTVNSPRYDELVQKCTYVIHPSCSEGQPGSVVQCMYSGLVPIVTKEAGIDTEEFGITFSDDSIEEIERVMLEVSKLPEGWHREHSIRTREVCERKYSEEAFINRWIDILSDILNSGRKNNES